MIGEVSKEIHSNATNPGSTIEPSIFAAGNVPGLSKNLRNLTRACSGQPATQAATDAGRYIAG